MWTIVIALIVAIWAIATYNRLLVYRHRVENARAQVDVQLKRRYDLIPRLVETVRGYAQHEERIFERIAELRTRGIAVADAPAAGSIRGAGASRYQ
jgi:LemA protein